MRLLVWDAPNIDATLANILDRRPGPTDRPDLAVLRRWLDDLEPQDEVEACIFVNIPEALASGLRGWIQFLSEAGFRVFAKPKLQVSDDIDQDMLDHISKRTAEGNLREVVVASHDSRNFLEPLTALARDGVSVKVLAFEELAGDLADADAIQFVDLESVPGLFREELPRVNLRSLPPDGKWFEPRRGPFGDPAPSPRSPG